MKKTWSANISTPKTQKIYHNITLDAYVDIDIAYKPGMLVYLYGALGIGKTSFSQVLLGKMLKKEGIFPSPTYIYYNCYAGDIYHFDLYRLQNYEEFCMIGGEEILLGRSSWCILVEWPECIDSEIQADVSIYFEAWDTDSTRTLRVEFTPQYLASPHENADIQ